VPKTATEPTYEGYRDALRGLLLIEGGEIAGEETTYRGDGMCFL
jgi:hypothetical protein